jgi:hypothetical protein
MRRLLVKRRIPVHQLVAATVLGIIGGYYVWRPLFDTTPRSVTQDEPVALTQNQDEPSSLSKGSGTTKLEKD